MGRFVVAVAAVAALVLLLGGTAQGSGGWSTALDRLWSTVAATPQCELSLTDGTTTVLPVAAAAALTTAAAAGAPADPARTGGIGPEQLDLTRPAGVTCTVPRPSGGEVQSAGDGGLTPRAAALHEQVLGTFGEVPYGGFAPGGVVNGHGARSAHYEGRAVDYFFRPVGDEQQRARGWALANWLVANAQRLEVAVVIFDDRIWSARRSAQGWRSYSNPDGGTDPISRHLDHVHVDVIRGG